MQRSTLGVGIIGAGIILRRHAIAYRCLPELARLIAVADIDSSRAEAAKREHRFAYSYTDYRELLARDDIDVVSVCTPPQVHTPVVIDAVRAGKKVLCEKPMARTLEEADLAIQTCDSQPEAKVGYVFQYRTDPMHMRIREMVKTGALGRVLLAHVRVRAQRMPAYYARVPGRGSWAVDGGGVLINQSVHQLDALISFMGAPIEVSAVMDTFVQPTEAEDTLAGWIKFENGALATVDCTVCAHEDCFEIEVIGENAQTAVQGSIDRQYCDWSLKSKSSAVERALRRSMSRDFPGLPAGRTASRMKAEKLACKLRGRPWLPPRHFGHTPYVREFLKSVCSGQDLLVPPREARKSLELAVALYASAITRETVRLPIDERSSFYHGVSLAVGAPVGK